MVLLDAEGLELGAFRQDAAGDSYAGGRNEGGSDSPIARAVITFSHVSAVRFVLDNLTHDGEITPPPPPPDDLKFYVFFGVANPPETLLAGPLSEATFNPGFLRPATTYYWRVAASDICGSSEGPLWSFATAAGVAGDIDGDGSIDLADLVIVLGAFGACEGDAAYVYGADLDADACVDMNDLTLSLATFGR
jgi:hypothetical protein